MTTQPESRLSRSFMQLMRSRGAYVWKNHGSEFMPAGLPDIVGVYRGHFIAVETKMPGNTPSPVQQICHRRIEQSGGRVIVASHIDEVFQMLNQIDDLYG